MLYATLLGKYLPHNQRKGPPIHPIGFQIFDTLENLHKRLQLTERLVGSLVTKTALVKELKKKLIPLVKKAGDRRNVLVHGYWGINETEYPNSLMLIREPGDFLIYEESDFNEAIILIEAADAAVTEFELKVRKLSNGRSAPAYDGSGIICPRRLILILLHSGFSLCTRRSYALRLICRAFSGCCRRQRLVRHVVEHTS